ncbi:MAG: serine hydrolase domain-containing protein [Pseudomonadota bacterium]|jgi:CubicO group peptidase (beta-lactamase class C family)|nr:beta-lactamase family protein [Erythrobacter sp.]MEE2793436.1 serine hydrolase domain-containing protein [Pseudomonadota bacterium]|tara:strand:- start:268 stop:1518 length:1251 start_codon:yes stop_codon:yes gene_type:complete
MFELADAGTLGFDDERLARIAPFLAKTYIDSGRLPNAQLVIARDGQPVHYTKLGSMGDDKRELRDDALFRIASMTKPVTSIAFMQLVEQCEVALEEPVARIFPEFADLKVYAGGGGAIPFAPGKPASAMRFVDLLTHMSGLTYGLQNRNNIDAAYRENNFDFARDHLDSDAFIEKLSKLPLEFAPGTGWNYSVSTDVLGVAVERISGMRLGDYFEKHIFAPLGMTDTHFGVAEGQSERLVDAYAYQPGHAPKMINAGATSKLNEPGAFDSGGGGLIGTIADYHRFSTMLLNGGELDGARIVSPKTIRLMRTNHLPNNADLTEMSSSLFSEANNAGTGFGLGFAMVIDPSKTLMPSSEGEFYWGGAYSTAFFVDPVERITMVFMTQVYPSSTYPIRRQLKTLIYSALTDSYADGDRP